MNFRNLFKGNKNELEGKAEAKGKGVKAPVKSLYTNCTKCRTVVSFDELKRGGMVCPKCAFHFKMKVRSRMELLVDRDTFVEHDAGLQAKNHLNFPGYDEKIRESEKKSGEPEAVLCGIARIGSYPCGVFFMNPFYMMGSMGTVVGEKITNLFEYAALHRLPVVGVCCSGGARMQEGMLSLMQMAKVSGAVKRHSDGGNFYLSLLTNPTSGGVTASFAMLADVILAEPEALICFAGPRVIEQTIRQKLPEGFQKAEAVFNTGFIDEIVPRAEQRAYITRLLMLHAGGRKDGVPE